jgi:hypothetical protein
MMSTAQVADAATFALSRPAAMLIENITLSSLAGYI